MTPFNVMINFFKNTHDSFMIAFVWWVYRGYRFRTTYSTSDNKYIS